MSITTPELGGAAPEEDDMNPVLIQAIAAERTRELHADAAATSRAGRVRRSRRGAAIAASSPAFPVGARTLAWLAAARPLRGPRPA
jgi:hypothetical protein